MLIGTSKMIIGFAILTSSYHNKLESYLTNSIFFTFLKINHAIP